VLAESAEQPYRLSVLELETDDVHDEFAHTFTESLRTQVRSRADYTLVETKVSLVQLSMAQDCTTAQPECLAKIARGLEVDGFLFGKLTHEGGAPVAVLRRYDARKRLVDGSGLANFESHEASATELEQQAVALTTDLLGQAPPKPTAAVVPPSEAQPVLKLQPTTPPESLPAAENAANPLDDATTESSGIGGQRIAGYALIGGAVVFAGLSVLSFVQIDHAVHDASYERYRMSVGQMNASVRDVCDEASAGRRYGVANATFRDAKSACSTGTTFEILQFVFIGSAILSGGLATYLLATDSSSSERARATAERQRFTLRPGLAGRGGTLTARFRF
jgi:hypothetical protein